MPPTIPRVDRIKTVYSSAKKLNFAFRMTGYPHVSFNNGVTEYRPHLHRVTFRFCKQNESSVGMRNFVRNSLVKFGTENPSCAIYVIPARNCVPTLRAEYANGRTIHLNTQNMSLEQVHLHLNNLRTRSGEPIVRFESAQTAQCKSTQGMWSPIYWLDTAQNLYIGKLPQLQFAAYRAVEPSAQDYVVQNCPVEKENV